MQKLRTMVIKKMENYIWEQQERLREGNKGELCWSKDHGKVKGTSQLEVCSAVTVVP